jgi:tetratricopeptide (TPR) repeat protein
MKAERRHELQTNSLAKFIEDLPFYLRFHANKLLVGVIIVCAVILLMRYRNNAVLQAREATRDYLSSAHSGLEQLQTMQRLGGSGVPEAEDRKQLANQIETALDQVLQNTKDPDDSAIRADALVKRGDLNWTLANLPPLPGAATQPALLLPHSSNEYLENAAGAYQEVLKDYSSQMVPKATALLGLAAIEENRGNWDKASGYFNQLTTDASISDAFKTVAQQNLAMIPQLRNPVYLGSYSSTQPSSTPTPSTRP